MADDNLTKKRKSDPPFEISKELRDQLIEVRNAFEGGSPDLKVQSVLTWIEFRAKAMQLTTGKYPHRWCDDDDEAQAFARLIISPPCDDHCDLPVNEDGDHIDEMPERLIKLVEEYSHRPLARYKKYQNFFRLDVFGYFLRQAWECLAKKHGPQLLPSVPLTLGAWGFIFNHPVSYCFSEDTVSKWHDQLYKLTAEEFAAMIETQPQLVLKIECLIRLANRFSTLTGIRDRTDHKDVDRANRLLGRIEDHENNVEVIVKNRLTKFAQID